MSWSFHVPDRPQRWPEQGGLRQRHGDVYPREHFRRRSTHYKGYHHQASRLGQLLYSTSMGEYAASTSAPETKLSTSTDASSTRYSPFACHSQSTSAPARAWASMRSTSPLPMM